MYSGTDVMEEDLELERYGLEEEYVSSREESDNEDVLYRQIHYDLTDSDLIQTNNAPMIVGFTASKGNVCLKSGYCHEICVSQSDVQSSLKESLHERNHGKVRLSETVIGEGIFEGDLSDIDVILEEDVDKAEGDAMIGNVTRGRTRVKTDCEQIKRKFTTRPVDVVIEDSDDSSGESVVVVETKSSKKRRFHPPPQNDALEEATTKASSEITNKAPRIDRNSFKGSSGKRNKRERKLAAKSDVPTEVIIIADDDSEDGSRNASLAESKDVGTSQHVGILSAGEAGSEFFIDSRGMQLDDVRKEKQDAQSLWKQERRKTKAMLKEAGDLDVILGNSDDEDCMMIESCSEEEGMKVHFEKGKSSSLSADVQGQETGGRRRFDGREKVGRYFIQSKQKQMKCYNCFEMGHAKADCPEPPYVPACILCGTKGHTDRECPRTLCFNCSLPGHQSRLCPIRKNLRYAVCDRCQMPGHVKRMCPDLWRQYHLTTELGPLIRPTNKQVVARQRDVYCSNCSLRGHRYYDCHSARFDDYVLFTYDVVCQYDARLMRQRKGTEEKTVQPRHRLYEEWEDDESNSRQDVPNHGPDKRKFSPDDDSARPNSDDRQETRSKKRRKESKQDYVTEGFDGGETSHNLNEHIDVGASNQAYTASSLTAKEKRPKKKKKKLKESKEDCVTEGFDGGETRHNLNGHIDEGASNQAYTASSLTTKEKRRKKKKNKSKSQRSVESLVNEDQEFVDECVEEEQDGGTSSCLPAPHQEREKLPKGERQKLRREKWLAKKQSRKSKKRRPDDDMHSISEQYFPKLNFSGGPEYKTTDRGFILNADLAQHGGQKASFEDDFPRSTYHDDHHPGWDGDGTKKSKKGRKLRAKMKHNLLDLRDRIAGSVPEVKRKSKKGKTHKVKNSQYGTEDGVLTVQVDNSLQGSSNKKWYLKKKKKNKMQ